MLFFPFIGRKGQDMCEPIGAGNQEVWPEVLKMGIVEKFSRQDWGAMKDYF